jgi:Spy/CpxP family protein refolding chaperone
MPFDRTNRKAVALLALVFALGLALGAVGHMAAERDVFAARQRNNTRSERKFLNRLSNELKLTPEQQQELDTILADTKARYDAIRQSVNPQFQQVREQSNERIREVLTPEQRAAFDEFLQTTRDDRRKRGLR